MHKLIESLPKAELHLHIEGGSMYPNLALELSQKNKVPLPFDDINSAKAYYAFSSLDHFIDILRTTVATLCTAEDYARCVDLQGARASKQFLSMAQHSILKLHRAGVCVTINSDDPPMFDCEMTDDFKAVADTFELSVEDIVQIARNGFEASFMEPGEKATALRKFDDFVSQSAGL